ncbi:MAG TPA: hypothetical protein VKM94_09265 [Blastocatellia bacterium]|nr:hypothetical protein [Blastocatellia bacterium]
MRSIIREVGVSCLALFIVLGLAAGCDSAGCAHAQRLRALDCEVLAPSDTKSVQGKTRALSALLNLAYIIPAGDEEFGLAAGLRLRFKNGKHNGKYSAWIDKREVAFGDLNGDGATDALVIFRIEGAKLGNQTLCFLAVVLNVDSSPVNPASIELPGWDIRSTKIESDTIKIELMTWGPDDPRCCPSVKQQLQYRFAGGKIVEARP